MPPGHRNPVVEGWSADDLRLALGWRIDLPDRALEEVRNHLERNDGRVGDRVTDTEFRSLTELGALAHDELAIGSGVVWIRPSASAALGCDDLTWSALFSIVCSLLGMAHRTLVAPDPEFDLTPALTTTHVDGLVPDVIGAVRLSEERAGHEILLSSGPAIHRQLEDTPEVLRALYRPVLHDLTPADGVVRAPVFRYEPRLRSLELRYDRERIEHTHDLAGVPLPDVVRAAFDQLDKAMVVPELLASIRPSRGDMVLLNNRRAASAGITSAIQPGVVNEVRALRVVNPAPGIAIAGASTD